MKYIIILFLFLSSAWSAPISDFKTDGCSMVPNGHIFQSKIWLHCCYIHDIWYWAGGNQKWKEQSDLELSQCVEQSSGIKGIGKVFYQGVNHGGKPSAMPWSWKYGYPIKDRNYINLTKSELLNILDQMPTIDTELAQKELGLSIQQIIYINIYKEKFENNIKQRLKNLP